MTLACIFQPAHVLEDVQFAQAEVGGKMEDDTFSHQLKSTANFGTGSRVFTWLRVMASITRLNNYPFPNVCHIHFRAFAPIVKKTAEEFGLPLPFLHHLRQRHTARTHTAARAPRKRISLHVASSREQSATH